MSGDLTELVEAWGAEVAARAAARTGRPADHVPGPAPVWSVEHVAWSRVGDRAAARRSVVPCPECGDNGAVRREQEQGGLTYAAVAECSCRAFDMRCERFTAARVPLLESRPGVSLLDVGVDPLGLDWTDRAELRGVIHRWCRGVREGNGAPVLLLAGPTGTGKTHIAAGLVRWACFDPALSLRPTWTRWREYLDACGKGGDPTRKAAVRGAPMLVVDELSESGRDWGAAEFEDLIDARISAKAPTVVTTNTAPGEDLRQRIGDRAWSRLVGGAVVSECVGEDWRLRRAGGR